MSYHTLSYNIIFIKKKLSCNLNMSGEVSLFMW